MGARGVYAASKSVERDEFRAYVASRDLKAEFPGAIGFGFIERVERARLEEFLVRERADNAPDFKVWSITAHGSEMANRSDLYVIKHCFPEDRNKKAWGLDVGSEKNRRDAAEVAVATGQPAITAKITLVQDGRQQVGFLYYVPVYHNGAHPTTPEERLAALTGLCYAPIILNESLDEIIDSVQGELDFEIFDGEVIHKDYQLYDYDRHLDQARGVISDDDFKGRMFEGATAVQVGGRIWTFTTSTTPKFDANVDYSTPIALAIGGVLVSLIAGGLAYSLMNGRAAAVALARSMTEDLSSAKTAAESALREVAAFRATLDKHSIISITDCSGKIIEVNDEGCKISGYSREELLGQNHRILNSGHHPKSFWVDVWKTIGSGKPWRGEICNRRKDGLLYWVDSIIAPFMNADGQIERYVSIRTDVTQRVVAGDRVAASESKFRTLADSAPILVWTSGIDARCDYFNNHWLAFTGATLEESIGDGWMQFVHPEDLERRVTTYKNAFMERHPFELEYRLRRHDGVYRTIIARGVPRIAADGSFEGFVGACSDVTELRANQAKAEAASRAKSEFLANMSHEIRTPLTAILGFADVLREDGDTRLTPEQRVQTIDTIRNAGQHLLAVINDILDLSKIEAERMTVEHVETPLAGIIREVDSLIRPRAVGKGLKFLTRLATPIPELIRGDPTRLRQILMNLVGNATKFTEAGAVTITVAVDAAEYGQHLRIDIEDTGAGMTSEQAAGLFQCFGQADASTTRRFGGTGLGLVICRRLARLMRGDVTLERSEMGKGSCFRLMLPMEIAPGTAMVECLDAIAAPDTRAKPATNAVLSGRILLAEDGVDNQRLMAFHLRKAGAEVDIADHGAIALEMIHDAIASRRSYDLLLTDMQMPVMDGYTLAQTLRLEGITIPIIAVTAHAMAEDRQRCLDVGCDDYASKPIEKSQLLSVCAKWLHANRSLISSPRQVDSTAT